MFNQMANGGQQFSDQFVPPTAASSNAQAASSTVRETAMEKFVRYFPWMIFAVVLAHVLYLIYFNLNFGRNSTNFERVIDDSFILLGELFILAGCVYALKRIQQMSNIEGSEGMIRRARLAVIFLTLSALFNSVGQIFWIWYDGTLPAVPYPGIDDALFLSNYPFFFIGIALLIPRGGSVAGRARVLVDAGTLVLSVLAIFWYFILGPTLATLSGTALVKAVSLAYPLSDLAAAVAAILLYLNPFSSTVPRRTLARLTLGIAVSATSNMIYGYTTASGTYYTGLFVDAGFPLTWMLIAWAVFTYPSDLQQMMGKQPEQVERRTELSSRVSAVFRAILPLLFTILTSALLLLIVAVEGNVPLVQVVLVCAGLFLLPVIRQSLMLVDNMVLNERLRVALGESRYAFQQSQDKLISTTLRAEQLQDLLTGIENLQAVHARLAQGDFKIKAAVQGPLAPVAQSLNLLIERMNRWAQAAQVNRMLMEEANALCRVLETLSEGQLAAQVPYSNRPLPTSHALLITGRLQTRLGMRFQRQRESLRMAEKRLQMLKNLVEQAQGSIQGETFDRAATEQLFSAIGRSLASYESLLQDLWNHSNIYVRGTASPYATQSGPLSMRPQ
jgi:hypothetical protein